MSIDGSAPREVEDALTGADYLLHLAAVKSNDPDRGPEEILRTNVLGTYQLFEAAARAGVRRIVFTSSLYAYGRMTGPPMREDEPALPATVYGTSKLAGERFLCALAAKGGPAFNSLRCFFAYGPGPSRESSYRSVVTLNDRPAAEGRKRRRPWRRPSGTRLRLRRRRRRGDPAGPDRRVRPGSC